MAAASSLAISVVIPVRDSAATLNKCLAALRAQLTDSDEVIVVDDHSSEDVRAMAERHRAVFIRLDRHCGVAVARNRGAATATRPILFFVDADVIVHADVLDLGRAWMGRGGVDAVIGSYDDNPAAQTVVSRFKNLAHHHFHHRAAGPIGSFWAACGFVRREVFLDAGGFDETRFLRPSIEDVEFGWRLTDRGGCILLDPKIQATHLKRWTLRSLITTDVFYRAIPWIRWSLERRRLSGELNASPAQQVASVLAITLVSAGAAIIRSRAAVIPFVLSVAAALLINRRLYRLFWQKGGVRLLVGGFALQQLYYLCALTGAALGVARYCWRGRRVAAPPARVGC